MSKKTRIIIFLLSIALYVGAFMFMNIRFHKGEPTMWIIPVLAAGWLFGMWPAVIVGLACLPVNALLLTLVGADWRVQILGGGAIAGAPATVIIGAVVGRLRDLSSRLHKTIAEKVLAEEGLRSEIERRKKIEGVLMENEEKYRALSITDPLTGLYNRRHFFERATAELDRAARYETPVSLFIYDIDHFKKLNDTCGHLAGDMALKVIAAASEKVMRKIDILARYGGEEFVCMLPETDLAAAQMAAERVRQEIEASPIDYQGKRLTITASFGIGSLAQLGPQKAPTQDILQHIIRHADDALYQAKASGRNRVCISSPSGT
jgi:diguanylate cyclase (GGDEF)-like protein